MGGRRPGRVFQQPVKGEASDLSFFSRSGRDFIGTQRDYLVLVHESDFTEDIDLLKVLERAAEGSQRKRFYQSLLESTKCSGNKTRYYIGGVEQAMIPFDTVDSGADESILMRDDPFRGPADRPPLNLFWDIDLALTEVQREGKTYWRARWSDAREMILREVAGEPIPRRSFPKRSPSESPEDASEAQ